MDTAYARRLDTAILPAAGGCASPSFASQRHCRPWRPRPLAPRAAFEIRSVHLSPHAFWELARASIGRFLDRRRDISGTGAAGGSLATGAMQPLNGRATQLDQRIGPRMFLVFFVLFFRVSGWRVDTVRSMQCLCGPAALCHQVLVPSRRSHRPRLRLTRWSFPLRSPPRTSHSQHRKVPLQTPHSWARPTDPPSPSPSPSPLTPSAGVRRKVRGGLPGTHLIWSRRRRSLSTSPRAMASPETAEDPMYRFPKAKMDGLRDCYKKRARFVL